MIASFFNNFEVFFLDNYVVFFLYNFVRFSAAIEMSYLLLRVLLPRARPLVRLYACSAVQHAHLPQ